MKSLGLVVDRPDTVGAAPAAEQVLTADFGTLALGSNGEAVLAPVTANSSPLAKVGVPLSVTVITSDVNLEEAIPYHSVWVVSCTPVHAVYVVLAEPIHVIWFSESPTEDTVIEDPDMYVTTQSIMTSFAFAVVADIVNDKPDDQVPVVLPSRVRVPEVGFGSVNACRRSDRARCSL